MARRQAQEKQLKKQPKLQRANKTARFSQAMAPAASVTSRKRHKQWRKVEGPLKIIQNFVFSARWVSLAILIVAGYFLYGFINSPEYFITSIPIAGAESVPKDEIAETSGLAGVHIFAADPEAAAEAILDLPGIVSADVRLEWPNQVEIVVQEEQPVAVWVSEGTTWWINREGGLFPARETRADLLTIEALGTDGILGQILPTVDLEQNLEDDVSATADVAEVEVNFGSIPDEILHGAIQLSRLQPYGEPIQSFRYNGHSGLHFSDPRGWDAHFGTGVNMDQKLAVYNALVAELEAQGIAPIYISVENPSRPIYRSY